MATPSPAFGFVSALDFGYSNRSFAYLKNKVGSFFLLSSFKSSFYILGNSPLLDVCFANTFPQSVGCLLIVLTVSLT